MPRQVRERLLPQQACEIDVEVAAFAVFQAVCLEARVPCPRITEYFNNKKAIRTWLSAETGLHIDDVKAHVSAMHACPGYVWPEPRPPATFQWIEGLRAEIKQVYALMRRYSPVFSSLVAEAKKHNPRNAEGAAMSMFREIQERRMLEVVSEFLGFRGFPVCGLIHDALLFSVSDDEKDLEKGELESYASQRLGFPVKFSLEYVRTNAPFEPPRERETFPHFTVFDDRRLHPIDFDVDAGIRCLVISAGMNMGKTWCVAKFLASLPRHMTALIVSTRILHAIATKSASVCAAPRKARSLSFRTRACTSSSSGSATARSAWPSSTSWCLTRCAVC